MSRQRLVALFVAAALVALVGYGWLSASRGATTETGLSGVAHAEASLWLTPR